MSNSSVNFVNVKNLEVDLDRNYKISIEYVVDRDVKVSHSDWIAIYPQGSDVWNSINVDLMVAYEFVLPEPIRKGERRYKMDFSLKVARNLKYGQKYQFFYISKNSDIYGISETFEFRQPLKEIPNKLDSGRESDEGSKENVGDNQSNDKKRKINRRVRQPLVKEEPGKREPEDNGRYEDHNRREAMNFINKFNRSKEVFVKKQMDIGSNSGSCTTPTTPPPISCSNCHRVGSLLRAQEELYNKIKNLAEVNNDLRTQLALLQQRIELSQAACQKLTVTLMRERQAKLYYQAALYERAEFEYEYSVLVMEPFVPTAAVFVPTSRNLPVPSRHRAEEKAKVGCSVLKLKAIIGSQEDKIRKLTKEIVRMKMGRDDSAKLKSTDEITVGSATLKGI